MGSVQYIYREYVPNNTSFECFAWLETNFRAISAQTIDEIL